MQWHIPFTRRKRIYLDYAAATPVSRSVLRAMRPYFRDVFANASAVHAEGVAARTAVEDARERVARLLTVRPDEIAFTSGGTESNNLAIAGVLTALHEAGRAWKDMHVITTPLEHPSVLATLEHFAEKGVRVTHVSVSEEGLIDMTGLAKALQEETVLVTCAYANSEIGVVQEIKQLSKRVRAHRKAHACATPFMHLDASQAPLWLPLQMDSLGVDLMTLDAGKCEGPKGVGVLAHRRSVSIVGHLHGGSQERGLRAGTESVALIVGCARAFADAQDTYKARAQATQRVRDYGITKIQEAVPEAILNGSLKHRLANNINISIPDIDSEYAVMVLDARGVAVSSRSACDGGTGGGSHVVRALGHGYEDSAIRLTLAPNTTQHDMDYVARILAGHVAQMRSIES